MLNEDFKALECCEAEETRAWDAYDAPQRAYDAACERMGPFAVPEDMDTMLHAAVKLGKAAERVLEKRRATETARDKVLALMDRIEGVAHAALA